jgi:hypothetical protein
MALIINRRVWQVLSLMAAHDGRELRLWPRRAAVTAGTGIRFGWLWSDWLWSGKLDA